MTTGPSFGQWLKQKRKALGLTQETLADLAACSAVYVRKIEADQRRATRGVVIALLDALGVPQEAHAVYLKLARAPLPAQPGLPSPGLTTLPVAPTPLIDREREVAAVRMLLLRDDVRLVTLTGAAGVGKTRVALEAATELWAACAPFQDGLFFVNLAPLQRPDLVLSDIAQTLGVRESQGGRLVDILQEHLVDKDVLLVLDNFEHVMAAAPDVSVLLASAPHLKVMVTSREVLKLRGEQTLDVEPLAVPPQECLPLARLAQNEAVRLFVACAQAAQFDFALTDENGQVVAAICRHLDGLPLAIELAAARVPLLPPQAMLRRLASRVNLLTVGPRDAPLRQQTLRAALEWSYNLLSAADQTLYRRLAVFVGGRTLAAAQAVCNADGDFGGDMLDRLGSLIDKSLLRQAEMVHGEPRYWMLATIAEFGLERLVESGEADMIRRRHAEYYLGLAEETESKLRGPEPTVWLNRLEAEHDNLRAALHWCVETEQVEMGLRLAGALGWFWYLHSHLTEGRGWLKRVLSQASSTPSAATAQALAAAGSLAFAQGDYAVAAGRHEEALTHYRAVGDRRGVAMELGNLGAQLFGQGEYARARALLEESVALYRVVGDTAGLVDVLNTLGEVARVLGEYEVAGGYYAEGLRLAGEGGAAVTLSWLLHNLGHVALHRGDDGAAAAYFEQGLSLGEEVGFKPTVIACVAGLAAVWGRRGDAGRAARLLSVAEALLKANYSGFDPTDQAEYERNLALVRAHLDHATFAAAWREGQALTLEEAVACALEAAPTEG